MYFRGTILSGAAEGVGADVLPKCGPCGYIHALRLTVETVQQGDHAAVPRLHLIVPAWAARALSNGPTMALDVSGIEAAADVAARLPLERADAAPTLVRIKRKRDEPALPGFVLGGKAKSSRSSLASLLLGGAPSCPVAPVPQRYKLVSTTANGGADSASPAGATPVSIKASTSQSAAALREQVARQQQKQQQAARFKLVAMRRSGSAAEAGVLELQRFAYAPPAPKLVPFGAPLPLSGRSARPERWAATTDPAPRPGDLEDELAQVWADAAVAAAEGQAHSAGASAAGEGGGLGGSEGEDEYVYDEYTVADGADDQEGSDVMCQEEIWWEEVDLDAFGLEEGADYSDDDSNAEGQDYPEDESSDVEDDNRRSGDGF